jgi:hypothetical protein
MKKKYYEFKSECCHAKTYRLREWSICKECKKRCFLERTVILSTDIKGSSQVDFFTKSRIINIDN